VNSNLFLLINFNRHGVKSVTKRKQGDKLNEVTWFDNYFGWLKRLLKKLWRYLKAIGNYEIEPDWMTTWKSKKLTVKGFLAILVLVPLACFGLFGVMLITLVLTRSGTAVLIAIYAYGAVVVLLCIFPWKRKRRPQT